jgi:hypothetical protein
MAKQNVTDESGPSTGDDSEPNFVQGYQATDPHAANSPNRPSNQEYYGPGSYAVAYKKAWKTKPGVLPNGEGDDGSF